MTVHYLGDPRYRAFSANGVPLAGGKLHTFAEASSTPKAAFSENTGTTAHTNPIVLDANGEAEIWLDGKYKIRLDDATDVQQWTMDGVAGVGFQDAAAAVDEWVETGDTPTHIDDTNLSVPGDKRGTYQVGRRLRATISAGTVYGTITVSAFTTITTVTMVWDSGTLDSGLSAVAVGFLSVDTPSIPGVELSEDDWTFQGNTIMEGTQTVNGTLTVPGAQVFSGDMTHTGRITADGVMEPGDFIYSMRASKAGFFLCRNQTVGSAASGATEASDAYDLVFTQLWDTMADAEAPVSSGRGASAAADFAADKTITLPEGRGAQLMAKDDMSGASANVVTDANADIMGKTWGAELRTLVTGNLPAHDHGEEGAHQHDLEVHLSGTATDTTNNPQKTDSQNQTTVSNFDEVAGAHTHASVGSGTAFSLIHPSLSLNLFVRH